MADGDYKFSLTLDNTKFELDIKQAKKAFASLASEAKKAGAEIDNIPNPFDKIGSSAPQVAQTTQQFGNLNMATQQLVRELPAATMGLNTFFLAVSNNLPVFADQVKRVNEENRNLAAQGKPTTSVIKQIVGSLFSSQTALVLVVTALSMYGKEIGAWISSLFKGKSALDAVKEAAEGLNASIEENGLGIGKEIGKYESLRREFESINGDLEEQERFVRDNQEAFDDLGISVNSVIAAENFFSGEGTEAFLKALRLRAEALAAQELAVKQYEKAIKAETSASKLPEKIITSTTPIYARTRTGVVTTGYKVNTSDNPERKELEAKAKAARNLADAYFDLHDAKKQEADDTLEAANIEQNDQQTQAELRAAELRAKQIADASARLMSDAQRKTTQAEVDAMKEGIQKKIAQINLNYDLEEQAITKREEDLKKLRGGWLTSGEQKAIDAMRKANASERDRSTQAAYDAVFAEADAWLEENNSEVEEAGKALNKELARRTKAWEDYFIEYGTIKEKILATTTKYNRLINEAETEGERMSLKAKRDAELKALDETMVEKSDLWVRLFGNAEKMSRRQLKSVIADTKQLLDYLREASDIKPIGFTEEQLNALKDDAEKIGAIYDELYEKQEEMERRNEYPFSNIINALKKLKEAREAEAEAEKEQDAASRQRKLESVESLRQEAGELGKIAASKAADTVTEIADAFMRLAEATDNANLKETAEQLGAFAQNLSAAGQGAASGGWIGAIVGGVSDMLMQTIDAIIGKQAEVHEYEQNRLDFMRQYQLMLLELNDSDYDSVFGTASLRKASDAWEKMAEAERLYKEATEGALGQFGGKMKEIANAGVGAFLFAPSLLDSRTTEEYKAYLDALQKGYNALEGMRVKTVDRSGWANFWGAKDEYANLKDLAPELWGEDGLFNAEAARAFLETNTQITDEQRKQIQNAIDLKDKYDEALSEIDQQIESIFGDLASDMTDIIFDSVRNGSDAWDEFGKKGAEIIDTLGKQMLQEMIMTEYLEQYTEDLRAAFASGDSSQIAGVVNNIFDNMGMMFEGMSAAAKAWDANAEEMGFDMNNISKTATTARGFQTMSQETGSELNGRFTDIQGQTHRIADAVEFMKGLQMQHTQHMQSVSNTLASIHTNTTLIEQHTRELSSISADINVMRRAIDNGAI